MQWISYNFYYLKCFQCEQPQCFHCIPVAFHDCVCVCEKGSCWYINLNSFSLSHRKRARCTCVNQGLERRLHQKSPCFVVDVSHRWWSDRIDYVTKGYGRGRSDRPPPQARRLNVPSNPHSKLEFVTRQVAVAPDCLRIQWVLFINHFLEFRQEVHGTTSLPLSVLSSHDCRVRWVFLFSL